MGAEQVLHADVAALHCTWEATSFQLERQQCHVPCAPWPRSLRSPYAKRALQVEQEEAGFKSRRFQGL